MLLFEEFPVSLLSFGFFFEWKIKPRNETSSYERYRGEYEALDVTSPTFTESGTHIFANSIDLQILEKRMEYSLTWSHF